jgi:Mg2+/Co2+ transporter CorB
METVSTELIFSGLAVIVLLGFSFFFSASETSLTATSRARMLQFENAGNKRAGLVNQLLEIRERLIGTILIGNNVVNTAAASLTTGVLLTVFGDVGIIYATVLVSLLVIVFSEVMPKMLAINYPERGAIIVAPVIAVLVKILGPVTLAIEWIVKSILRLFGVRIGESVLPLSGAAEIRGTVDLLAKEGVVGKDARNMLGGLLDLEDLDVEDVMIHRTKMTALDLDLNPAELVKAALDSAHTRIPVFRDKIENIVGILHVRTLMRALSEVANDPTQIDLDEVIGPAWFVPATTMLQDQLKAFLKKKAHMALVVDEYGEVLGLVTLEDIIEEIVGEISDETDERLRGVRFAADGSAMIDGQVPIRDLNRKLDWALPDEEATTIAGLVIHEARMIPDTGQTFTFYGFKFEVMKRERNKITRLRVTPSPDARRAARTG